VVPREASPKDRRDGRKHQQVPLVDVKLPTREAERFYIRESTGKECYTRYTFVKEFGSCLLGHEGKRDVPYNVLQPHRLMDLGNFNQRGEDTERRTVRILGKEGKKTVTGGEKCATNDSMTEEEKRGECICVSTSCTALINLTQIRTIQKGGLVRRE